MADRPLDELDPKMRAALAALAEESLEAALQVARRKLAIYAHRAIVEIEELLKAHGLDDVAKAIVVNATIEPPPADEGKVPPPPPPAATHLKRGPGRPRKSRPADTLPPGDSADSSPQSSPSTT